MCLFMCSEGLAITDLEEEEVDMLQDVGFNEDEEGEVRVPADTPVPPMERAWRDYTTTRGHTTRGEAQAAVQAVSV
jgi:hypothetical protein